MDKRLRAAAVINGAGETKERKARKGVKLILSPEEFEDFALSVALRAGITRKWDKKIGRTERVIIFGEKLKMFVFFLREDTLVVTAEPDISTGTSKRIASLIGPI